MAQPLIILGASVRSAARAAVAARYEPWCIDLRGDRDLREMRGATVRQCPVDTFPMGMLRTLEQAPSGAAVLFAGPLENHLAFIRAVGFEREILGSPVEAVEQARDPLLLPSLKPVKGLRFCETRTRTTLGRRLGAMVFGVWGRRKYLLKPQASWRGEGITWWAPAGRVPAGHYLQQHIRGQPYTAVFHGDGWSCTLLGITEQIVGEPAFGAADFQACGHVGPVSLSETARGALSHLGVQLTQRCDVRGVFTVDLIMDMAGTLWPVEVNPRYGEAAELIERSEGAITLRGERGRPRSSGMMHGMARVLARQAVSAPDVYDLFAHDQVADVPPPGRAIQTGEPICTVIAQERGRDAVMTRLREMAAQIYARVAHGD